MKYAFLAIAIAASTTVFASQSAMVFNDTQYNINIQYVVCKDNTMDCSSGAQNMWASKELETYIDLDPNQYIRIHTVREIDSDGNVIQHGVHGPGNRCIAHAGQALYLNLDRTTGVLCHAWGNKLG